MRHLQQDGLIARRDLREAGVCLRWVSRRIRAGELVIVNPGVLALPDFDRADIAVRFRGALLQAGPDAALSHTSPLEVYGLLENWTHDLIHVAVPRGGTKHTGWKDVALHRRRVGPAECVSGIPVVSPKEALVGSAVLMDVRELRFPAMQAVQQGLLSARELADFEGVPDRTKRLWRQLGEEALAGAESGGEANYYRLLIDAGLLLPRLQIWIQTPGGGKRLDAYWEELALGCEIDGERYHGGKDARDRDRVRRNEVQAEAVKLFDFNVDDVMRRSAYVVENTAANLLARAHELGVTPWW